MKVLVTKTSDWKFNEVREYGSLEECVKTLLTTETFADSAPELVVSFVPAWMDESRYCDYEVEIYDDWRE